MKIHSAEDAVGRAADLEEAAGALSLVGQPWRNVLARTDPSLSLTHALKVHTS